MCVCIYIPRLMLRRVCNNTNSSNTLLKAYETFSAIERRQKNCWIDNCFCSERTQQTFFFLLTTKTLNSKHAREHFFFFLSRWHPRGPFLRRLFISLVLDIIFITFVTTIKLLKLFVVSTRARDSFLSESNIYLSYKNGDETMLQTPLVRDDDAI